MIQLVIGALVLAFGLPFLIRGWIFTLKPEGKIALAAKERNLRLGLETDIQKWGRRVRRFGFLLALIGAGLIAWGAPAVL